MLGIDYKKSEKGMTLLEALVSTAIIGIGFVAVFEQSESDPVEHETLDFLSIIPHKLEFISHGLS